MMKMRYTQIFQNQFAFFEQVCRTVLHCHIEYDNVIPCETCSGLPPETRWILFQSITRAKIVCNMLKIYHIKHNISTLLHDNY